MVAVVLLRFCISFSAIQNDRDRIGPTKKMKLNSQSSDDDGTASMPTTVDLRGEEQARQLYSEEFAVSIFLCLLRFLILFF